MTIYLEEKMKELGDALSGIWEALASFPSGSVVAMRIVVIVATLIGVLVFLKRSGPVGGFIVLVAIYLGGPLFFEVPLGVQTLVVFAMIVSIVAILRGK